MYNIIYHICETKIVRSILNYMYVQSVLLNDYKFQIQIIALSFIKYNKYMHMYNKYVRADSTKIRKILYNIMHHYKNSNSKINLTYSDNVIVYLSNLIKCQTISQIYCTYF